MSWKKSDSPPGLSLPLCPRRKNKQTQQCRALCQSTPAPSPPSPPALHPFQKKKKRKERKKSCVSHREIPCAHPATHPISILGRDRQPTGQDRTGRRNEEGACCCYCHAAASILEQGIPKQLEGADIWCCALVVGPPQNGPVLSGNLVIFSASLARLQL